MFAIFDSTSDDATVSRITRHSAVVLGRIEYLLFIWLTYVYEYVLSRLSDRYDNLASIPIAFAEQHRRSFFDTYRLCLILQRISV